MALGFVLGSVLGVDDGSTLGIDDGPLGNLAGVLIGDLVST